MTALELQALRTGQDKTQLVDVRSASEYAAGHIPGAMNVPLEQIESRIDDFSADALIVLICQRGPRACMAATFLDGRRQTTVLDGGTRGWCQAGLPLVTGTKTRWAPERQVRLIAGLMVLAGTSLALLVNAHFGCSCRDSWAWASRWQGSRISACWGHCWAGCRGTAPGRQPRPQPRRRVPCSRRHSIAAAGETMSPWTLKR